MLYFKNALRMKKTDQTLDKTVVSVVQHVCKHIEAFNDCRAFLRMENLHLSGTDAMVIIHTNARHAFLVFFNMPSCYESSTVNGG